VAYLSLLIGVVAGRGAGTLDKFPTTVCSDHDPLVFAELLERNLE
jgi:hypothetical protein